MDPLPIFLTACSIFAWTAVTQYRTTVRLAKWLHLHHRETWDILGRPGTTFFKGDEDNRYFTRTKRNPGNQSPMQIPTAFAALTISPSGSTRRSLFTASSIGTESTW